MNYCGCNPPCGEPVEIDGWLHIPCKLVDPNRYPWGIAIPESFHLDLDDGCKVKEIRPLTQEEFNQVILEIAREQINDDNP